LNFRHVFWTTFDLEYRIAMAVFGGVLIVLVTAFVLSWRRKRRGKGPHRRAQNNKLEITYATALLGMAIFLINFSFQQNWNFWNDPMPRPGLTVRATGFQWCWDFHYLGQGVAVTGQCAGKTVPTLELPTGRSVRFQITSSDVVHAFWIPGLKIKSYAYPGHINYFTMSPLKAGRWPGRCAVFCGVYHQGMKFNVRAVPPAQFNRWLHAHGGPAQAVRP